ncbi:PREDICTED: zinc carboxypeptidase-like [Wasmannia auropunctata]|uniref:zinc carboxypeptidase-like n=1 Tax=Wasmannia auropunctata TaxID=64793 RepID=UPI0005EE72A2|nr:PREDICTED: zinc carboxypeptidase-like [Wasmannia auropunctata]
MWKIIILCTMSLVTADQATFHNYKVFKIATTTKKQAELLNQLTDKPDGFSFWKDPFVNKVAELMVAPHKLSEFHEIMTQIQALYEIYIENVQELINRTMSTCASRFDFKSYHTLDTIHKKMDDLEKKHPDKVQTVVGGKSYEGRPIKGVKVSFKPNNPGIFIEGGIHAREWISPATVMYILHQLLTSNNPEVRALAESHDWYIFPSFNPDGYVYTHTTNRLWRKTRKRYTNKCYGSDPNRNWAYQWNTGGSSNSPCSDIYAGDAPFSEIETKSMSQYIRSISDKFYAYISFHSYSQYLMFPYGHTKDHLENYQDLYAIASKSIAALNKRYGTEYYTGNTAEMVGIASGGSVDYVKGIFHIPIVYVYELRDRGRYGFLLPSDQIIPTGEETLDSLVAMFKAAKALGYPKNNSSRLNF